MDVDVDPSRISVCAVPEGDFWRWDAREEILLLKVREASLTVTWG